MPGLTDNVRHGQPDNTGLTGVTQSPGTVGGQPTPREERAAGRQDKENQGVQASVGVSGIESQGATVTVKCVINDTPCDLDDEAFLPERPPNIAHRKSLRESPPEPLLEPIFYSREDLLNDTTSCDVIEKEDKKNMLSKRHSSTNFRRPSGYPSRQSISGKRTSLVLNRQHSDLEKGRYSNSVPGRRGTIAVSSTGKRRDFLSTNDVISSKQTRSKSLIDASHLLAKLSRWRRAMEKRKSETEVHLRPRLSAEHRERLRLALRRVTKILLAFLELQRNVRTSLWVGGTYSKQKENIDFVPEVEENPMFMIFDASEFKANKQMKMTAEAKRILQKPPNQRTEEEIYYCQIGLRGIHSIADYPVRMQRKLAKYGRIECYEPGRALVKQGHMPHAFYFILFGIVLVCVADEDTGAAETMCFLHRGETFGELSIMNRTARQSTVITKTHVEVLSLDTEAYEYIFMVGGKKQITDPDHLLFMQGLQFMKGWPTEILADNSDEMVFSYFKRGSVIVKDTSQSKWIIIVKSGSVEMLKKLVKQKSLVNPKTGRFIPQGPTRMDILCAFQCNKLQDLLSRCNLTLPNLESKKESEDEEDEDSCKQSITSRAETALSELENLSGVLVTGVTDKKHRVASARPSREHKSDQSTTKRRRVKTAAATSSQELVGKRTILDDLNAGFVQGSLTEADRSPVFVHIQTLTKGEAYGIAPLVFPEQPGFCIVSNGADCVLLNKDFYLQNCPPRVLRDLKHKLSPYPNEEKLQSDLQNRTNWDIYKQATVNQIVDQQYKHPNSTRNLKY